MEDEAASRWLTVMRERYRLAYADAAETPDPRAAILPVPYDRTACFQAGARAAPDAILHASHQLEFFDVKYVKRKLS